MNKYALNGLYENLRLVCYQLPSFLNDFENESRIKTELERKISVKIKESIKNSISSVFDSTELVYKLLNAEEESDFQEIIGADDGRLD